MRLSTSAVVFFLFAFFAAFAHAEAGNQQQAGRRSFPVALLGNQFGGTGFVTINPTNNTAAVSLSTVGLGANVSGAGRFNGSTNVLPFHCANQTGSGGTGNGTTRGFDQNGKFNTTVSITGAVLNQILANPSRFRFGVSTGEYPRGAVTGSLMNGMTFGGTFSGNNVVGGAGAFSASIAPNANDIGSTFTSVSVNQGGVGTNGAQFLNLSQGGTLTNGRFTGAVQLTRTQAQAAFAASGVTPATNNPTAQFLTPQVQQDLATLAAQNGAQLDRTYMQLQVIDHQKVLQMIDAMLLPSANTGAMSMMLQQMRAAAAQHVAQAQTILSQLP